MAQLIIDGRRVERDDPEVSKLLAPLYTAKRRPLCGCRSPAPEMYVAVVAGHYIAKRMPNTGSRHAADCEAYEPPPELSGLGEVMGSAIQESPEGATDIKVQFSLSKAAGRAAPSSAGAERDSVKTDGTRLTLRGMLHYLWEGAGFNKWTPNMAGRRTWPVIRRHLLEAAEGKRAKGLDLADQLYIPEAWRAEQKEDIAKRRQSQVMKVATADKGKRRLLVVIAEVKQFDEARFGHKVIFKHVPDAAVMVNDDLYRRLLTRFDTEMALWNAVEGAHLLLVGTFSVSDAGVMSLEEGALMAVTQHWIPFESMHELALLDQLTDQARRFTKGLRYNLPSSRPLAACVLQDTSPEATALYIVPPAAPEGFAALVDQLAQGSALASWTWQVSDGPMPALPLPASQAATPADGVA